MTATKQSRVRAFFSPTYSVVVREPMEGRLRLDNVAPAVRQACIVGLVAVIGILGSLAFNDLWRRGSLVFVSDVSGFNTFLPVTLLPVTLICLFLAWLLILWGATMATIRVKLAVAVAFLLLNASVGRSLALTVGSGLPLGLRLGPGLVRAGYFAAAGLVLVSVLPGLRSRAAHLPLLVALVLALGACFGGQLWVHVTQVDLGRPLALPQLLAGAVGGIQNFLIPLLLVSLVALVEFSYRVAEAAATPVWDMPPVAARGLLVAFILAKLWFELAGRVGEWTSYVRQRPVQAAQAVGALALFALAALVFRDLRRRARDEEGTTEGLVYGSSFLLAVPVLIIGIVIQTAQFLLSQAGGVGAALWVQRHFPYIGLALNGQLLVWPFVLVAGLLLLTGRGRSSSRRELGAALVLLSLWIVGGTILQRLGYGVGFDATFADLLLTLTVAAYLAVAWARLDTAAAVRLGCLLGFTWLISTKGDPVARIAGVLTLPAALTLIFGVIFTLLTDSAFSAGDSRHFPRPTRPLVWVGYLLLSVTLTNFFVTTHGEDVTAGFDRVGYHFLVLPFAAWLVIRRRFAASLNGGPASSFNGGPASFRGAPVEADRVASAPRSAPPPMPPEGVAPQAPRSAPPPIPPARGTPPPVPPPAWWVAPPPAPPGPGAGPQR